MERRKLTLEELPPIMLAVSGIVGIGPMGIYRLIQGEYIIAIVDALAVGAFALIAWAVYVKQSVRIPSVCMALVAISAAVVSVSLKGGEQVIWMYPALVALFYLLKPREAALASLIAIAIVIPVIFEGRTIGQVAVYVASLGVTICLSVAFAALTAEQRRELRAITMMDPLTGAGNRRALDDTLERAVTEAQSNGTPLVLIAFDIDHFKSVNDKHGHGVGDRVLCTVADTVTAHIRPTDSCFRAGGEEFVVIAAQSGLEQAQRLAERLRVAISELQYTVPEVSGRLSVTASFGLAEYRQGESIAALSKRADDALYEAKRSGRNRLHLSDRTMCLSGTGSYEALSVDNQSAEGPRLSEVS
ncbi:MAG: GGDEF domain-containing protein [Pseudomonadota bacterium]